MRFVIDLQACQSPSRFRGIGRYAISLANEMVSQMIDKGHTVCLATNSAFPEEAEHIHEFVKRTSPNVSFTKFSLPNPCAAGRLENAWRQRAAELLREQAIAWLQPDFVHLTQLVADGWADDTVASIGKLGIHVPTALTQYDLIPLAMSDIYMPSGPFRDHYLRKIEGAARADLLLAISNYSRNEAIELLDLDEKKVVAISSGLGSEFDSAFWSRRNFTESLTKLNLKSGYLLYAPGGFDPRKNVDRLLEAYSTLPEKLRKQHPLVIASKLYEGLRDGLNWKAKSIGLQDGDLILTDYVTDDVLIDLYRGSFLYVFPSLHEGFGLPVLEAMSCGTPVIASNCTSIPEAVGMLEALFDPYSVSDIAQKMHQALIDDAYRERLKNHAAVHPKQFSWHHSADIAVQAIESIHKDLNNKGWTPVPQNKLPSCDELLNRLANDECGILPSDEDIRIFRQCYKLNCSCGVDS